MSCGRTLYRRQQLGNYGDRWSFNINVIKPDGTNDTLGPLVSDPTGSIYTFYTPTELGNYTIQGIFIGKTLNNQPNGIPPGGYSGSSMGNITNWLGDWFMPSVSSPVTMVVQQAPIPSYQETPLPTGYWTRPIYGTNHNWNVIAGEWLGGGDSTSRLSRQLILKGPTSSHIEWAVPFTSGGLQGRRCELHNIRSKHLLRPILRKH